MEEKTGGDRHCNRTQVDLVSFVCGCVGLVEEWAGGGGGGGLVRSLCVLVIQYVLLDRTWTLNVIPF